MHAMELMTLKEVAEASRVSESTVRRWVRSSELPAYRLGRQIRVRPEEFESFLDKRRLDLDASVCSPTQEPRKEPNLGR
jgi:excisionase family DNA binding protein